MASPRRAEGPRNSAGSYRGYESALGVRLGFTLPIALLLLALLSIAGWLGLD